MNRYQKIVIDWAREQTADGMGAPPSVIDALDKLDDKGKRRRKAERSRPRREAREAKDAASAALYEQAKKDAWARSLGRCEYALPDGSRCVLDGNDPDHALGGAYRQDCERLGAEGLIVACRGHHDQKHANTPTKRYWLDQARIHAIRIGGHRLLRLIEKATARDEMRHQRRAS